MSGTPVIEASAVAGWLSGAPGLLLGGPDGVMIAERSGRILAVNDLLCASLGLTRAEVLQLALADLDPRGTLRRHVDRLAAGGSDRFVASWHAGGRALDFETTITLAADARQLRFALRAGGATADRGRALYAFLIEANAVLVRARDPGQLYRQLCELATSLDPRVVFAWIGLVDPSGREIQVGAEGGPARAYIDGVRIPLDPDQPMGRGPMARAIRERRAFVVNDFLDDPIAAPWRERARAHGIRAAITVPLVVDGIAFGALMLCSSEAGVFDTELTQLLRALGENISHAIDFLHQRDANARTLETLRRSEGRYRLLAENVDDVIWVFDVTADRFDYVSPSVEKLRGYTAAEVLQQSLDEVLLPDSVAAVRRWLAEDIAAWQSGCYRPRTAEVQQRCRDGRAIWTEITARLHRDADSGHLQVHGVTREITERRAIARRLEQNQAYLQAILDAADQTILMMTVDGEILAINQIGAARLGGVPAALIGANLYDLLPGEVSCRRRERIGAIVASGRSGQFEDHRDGRLYRSRVCPIVGETPQVVIFASDITELRAAEEKRRVAEGRFREIVELATEGIAMIDASATITLCNRRLHEMLGRSEAETLGCAVQDLVVPEERARFLDKFRAVAGDPQQVTRRARYSLRHADGHALEVLLSATHLVDAAGNYAGSIGMITDITELSKTERELREALNVLESSPVVGFRWRAEAGWPVDYVSANVSRWGYTAAQILAGTPTYGEMVHPDDIARVVDEVSRHIASGESEYVQEYRLRAADGHYFWVEDHCRAVRDAAGRVLCFEGVVSDVDAKKRADAEREASLLRQRELNRKLEEAHNQLLQSEKMASIGQLAAGVAHELNNPIGYVHSNLGSLESYLRDIFAITDAYAEVAGRSADPAAFAEVEVLKQDKDYAYLKADVFELMGESREGLNRVKKIVQDLKDFSRAGDAEWLWSDLHAGLDSTLNIVWNELKYKCTVNKVYAPDLPKINCLPSQLNQVFMNLLVNAAHAIETRGEITITTARHGDAAVEIRFADTGKGIAAENMKRLFEPFFTTKPVGKGTGLGLSIAYGIVGKHKGSISAESVVGRGTTFTVVLPIDPTADAESVHAGT